MTFDQLRTLVSSGSEDVPVAEVHAIDPMIYLIYLIVADERQPLEDGRGRAVRFRSRYAAQTLLQDAGLRQATFIHRSAYDEMIGIAGNSQPSELRETVSFHADD